MRKFKQYEYQAGGWVNNSYPQLADSNQLTQLLTVPTSQGYEQSVQIGQRVAGQRQQRFAEEQAAIRNQFMSEQLALEEEQLQFRQNLANIEMSQKFQDQVSGLNITPGQQAKLNQLMKDKGVMTEDGQLNFDHTNPNEFYDFYKRQSALMYDPEVKNMIHQSKSLDALNLKADTIAKNLDKIATDPALKPYYEDMTADYAAIKAALSEAYASDSPDIEAVDGLISGFEYKLSDVGEAATNLATKELEVKTKEAEFDLQYRNEFLETWKIEDVNARRKAQSEINYKYGKTKQSDKDPIDALTEAYLATGDPALLDAINDISKAKKGDLYDPNGQGAGGGGFGTGIQYEKDGSVDLDKSYITTPSGDIIDLSDKALKDYAIRTNTANPIKGKDDFYAHVDHQGRLITNSKDFYEQITGDDTRRKKNIDAYNPETGLFTFNMHRHPSIVANEEPVIYIQQPDGNVIAAPKSEVQGDGTFLPNMVGQSKAQRDVADMKVESLNFAQPEDMPAIDYEASPNAKTYYNDLRIGWNGKGKKGDDHYVPPLNPELKHLAFVLQDTGLNPIFTQFSRSQEQQDYFKQKGYETITNSHSRHLEGKGFDITYKPDIWKYLSDVPNAEVNQKGEITIPIAGGGMRKYVVKRYGDIISIQLFP